MQSAAKYFLLAGVLFLLIGGGLYLAARLNLPLGRLPGDIRFKWGNVTVFIPLATTLLASIVLTIIFNVVIRLISRK